MSLHPFFVGAAQEVQGDVWMSLNPFKTSYGSEASSDRFILEACLNNKR